MPTAIQLTTTLNRQIGIEMEGYIDTYPMNISIPYCDIKEDGSLRNSCWDDADWDEDDDDDNDDFGVEIVTSPIRNLDFLIDAFRAMENEGWHVDDRAGTHIHVDVSDFTHQDRARLLRFGKGIERIMYMFVESYRDGNGYAGKIDDKWRTVFRKANRERINWDEINVLDDKWRVPSHLRRHCEMGNIYNEKYTWMNVFDTRYPTVEFRIFNAITGVEQLIMFARLAHGIVELVANTDIKQLNYIIKELYKETTAQDIARKFCEVIGLDFVPPLIGMDAVNYLTEKLARNNDEITTEAV